MMHGLTGDGIKDHRIPTFAATIARGGMPVILPEFPRMKKRLMSVEDPDDVLRVARAVPEAMGIDKVIMLAMSYARHVFTRSIVAASTGSASIAAEPAWLSALPHCVSRSAPGHGSWANISVSVPGVLSPSTTTETACSGTVVRNARQRPMAAARRTPRRVSRANITVSQSIAA